MAFQLPALPNFQTNIPQSDPLATYGKLLQLKALQGQQALLPLEVQQKQQAVQAGALQNQRTQMEIDSQKALQEAISSGAFNKYAGVETGDGTGFDSAGAYQDLVKNHNVLPDQASAAVNSLLTIAKNQAEISKTTGQAWEAQQNIRTKTLKSLGDRLGSINDMGIEGASKALDALKQDLVTNPKAFQGMTRPELEHLYAATLETLPAFEKLVGLEGTIADFHKQKSEAATAAQKVIPASGGLSPESQQAVAKDVAVGTNPQIQAGKEAVAAAEGRARAAIEAQQLRGNNSAVANVAPHLVAPATADAQKVGAEFAAAKSVSDRMQATMDAARKGNVVSYQIIPEEGTLQITTSQGVHRINRTEIEQYAGGGSLWQRMQGHFGKALTGQSIPKSVLDDMQDIQAIQQKGATEKYHNALGVINQTYGSTFKPVEMEGLESKKEPSGPPLGATHIVPGKDGKNHYTNAQGTVDLGIAP